MKKVRVRMGRPPKDVADLRNSRVTIRMTTEDKRLLEKDVRKSGLTFAAYLLKCWRESKGGR